MESLLQHEQSAQRFLETPPLDLLSSGGVEAPAGEPLPSGLQVGPYQIVASLGGGGMGEVYRARDTRLGRDVALKFLPARLSQDPKALERFQREARSESALNHPNICTLHDVGEHQGQPYLVMELLEGESLKQRLERGPLGPREVVDLGIEVGEALEAAHARGIVHRDIKPANIFLTRPGRAKVLDFGIAKILSEPLRAADSEDAVVSSAAWETTGTERGRAVGTVSYMSPEQARGEEVDARSDLFSAGATLYEMATGRQAFRGATPRDTMDAIVNDAPEPPRGVNPALPRELERIILKALEKDRAARYQSGAELQADLERLRRKAGRLKRILFAAIPVAAGLAIVFAVRPWGAKEVAPFRDAIFTQLTDRPGQETYSSLSPDGNSFVYAGRAAGNWDIYFQRVGERGAINLTKGCPADDTQPAFSPDGQQIAFRSERDGGGIFVMGSKGEPVRRVSDSGYNPAWSPHGREIVCATVAVPRPDMGWGHENSRLHVLHLAEHSKPGGHTGGKTSIPTPGAAQYPNWSPHGWRLAYTNILDIWTVSAESGGALPVTQDPYRNWSPVWSPDGKHIYFASDRGGAMNIWRVPVNERSGKVKGQAEPVTTPASYAGNLSFSRDGRRIAYVEERWRSNIQRIRFDPATEQVQRQPEAVIEGSRPAYLPDISPEGEWLAFATRGRQENIFVARSDGTGLRQLTDGAYWDRKPVWSPDGKQIVFSSTRGGGRWGIWLINVDGSGLRQLTQTGGIAGFWSPDGSRVAYTNPPQRRTLVLKVGVPGESYAPEALPAMNEPGAYLWVASWSPDGKKLAGNRIRPGGVASGVVLYSFESRSYRVLTEFGRSARWLSDSRRLIFQHEGDLYLADSSTGRARKLLSVSPQEEVWPAISPDDRWIYYSAASTESDIWLMSWK
ncbi:MAG: PD40 domain-containing protein [Bryobacterales bacterium]|nr:PD40 domain-containing protein [Bryobacterales bacterium]